MAAPLWSEYWKDDYRPLQAAGRALQAALREDESAPDADLYRRLTSSGPGSHLYFVGDNSDAAGNNGSPEPQTNGSNNDENRDPSFSRGFNGSSNASGFGTPLGGGGIRNDASPSAPGTPTSSSADPAIAPQTLLGLKHLRSIPLPSWLSEQLSSDMSSYSLMGLLAEASLAWISTDDKLFLWSFAATDDTSRGGFCQFQVPSKQPIVSVGLVRPKPGVFKASVEWCLIVNTPDESLLCALAKAPTAPPIATNGSAITSPSNADSSVGDRSLCLIPTRYSFATDNVKILSCVGTKSGRIFLGGDDGCMYEFLYDGFSSDGGSGGKVEANDGQSSSTIQVELDDFYDGNRNLPAILTEPAVTLATRTKRVWTAVTGSNNSNHYKEQGAYNNPRKCRKVNRTQTATSGLVTALVPKSIVQTATQLFTGRATAQGGGKIVQMVVDEERNCLYTLGSEGWICAFDISTGYYSDTVSNGFFTKKSDKSIRLAAVANAVKTARLYLEAVSRGQMVAPSSSVGGQGYISFPGGGASAQAGVGGMEGARNILKLVDLGTRGGRQQQQGRRNNGQKEVGGANILKPISIHVVPRSESSRLTLVAVTAGGVRYYYSSLGRQALMHGPSHGGIGNPLVPSNRLTLCHIRSPPPLQSGVSTSGPYFGPNGGGELPGGMLPRVLVRPSAFNMSSGGVGGVARVDGSLYNQGLLVLAAQESAQPRTSIRDNLKPRNVGSVLVAACPDSAKRKTVGPNVKDDSSSSVVQDNRLAQFNPRETTAPGGISETISTPLSSITLDSSSSSQTTNPMLPGGVVWDICVVSSQHEETLQASVSKLSENSKTPSDTELAVGLPPAYYPPSKIRSPLTQTMNATTTMTARNDNALAASISKTALSVMGNVLSNLLLSRPVGYGISYQKPSQESSSAFSTNRLLSQSDYRISKRECSNGFSISAEEIASSRVRASNYSAQSVRTSAPSQSGQSSVTASSKSPKQNPKSARLSARLTRPSVAPLNKFATQHLQATSSQDIVVLNAGGLHFFGYNTVLANLVETIMNVAGDALVRSDPAITSFFRSYGYKEGCAMCLTLAIGCGPAASGTATNGGAYFSQQVRSRATSAAFGRALRPKLVMETEVQNQNGAIGLDNSLVTSLTDHLVPTGYCFRASALSQGLNLLIARLARPIWNKPAVVVTEGRVVRLALRRATVGGENSMVTPAKVELLLRDDRVLEQIRNPLRNLLELMKKEFKKAVERVPGTKPLSQDNMMIDIDNDSDIGRLQYHHDSLRNASMAANANVAAGNVQQLTSSEAESIARLLEEKSIHSSYRLVSRLVQVINLFSLLQRNKQLERNVDWGLLHGLTFCQLVQTAEGHERLERLLNALLVTRSPSVTAAKSPAVTPAALSSAQIDQLANQFAEDCYLFFSPSARFAYMGLRKAAEAMAVAAASPTSYPSPHFLQLRNDAAANLKRAAQHWHSASQITGRILHKGKETYHQKALRAMQHDSPLAQAANALIQLEDVANAVEVCLLTAANFQKQQVSIVAIGRNTQSDGAISSFAGDSYSSRNSVTSTYGYAHSWEHDLYHKRHDDNLLNQHASSTNNGTVQGHSPSISSPPPSSSHMVAYGTDVTSKDAVETCHALLFYHLLELLKTRPELADKMVSAASASTDHAFLSAFFSFLLENGRADTLLRIDSIILEDWLDKHNDFNLLWRYFEIQGKHVQAGKFLWDRASDTNNNYPLPERIEMLNRALNSFTVALNNNHQALPMSTTEGMLPYGAMEQKITEVKDTLCVARLQLRILSDIGAIPKADRDISPDQYQRLNAQLIPISELYNNYAAACDLYNRCLLILHACQNDDSQTIFRLWKLVICKEIIPTATRNHDINAKLQQFLAEVELQQSVRLLIDQEPAAGLPIFEEGVWVRQLEISVIDLGKELYGSGADYVFPVDFLISQLEELRAISPELVDPSWSLKTVSSVGVPYLVILDAYDRLKQQDDRGILGGPDATRRSDYLETTVGFLKHWVASANNNSRNDSGALQELRQAMAKGALATRFELLKTKLENVPQANEVYASVISVEEHIRYIVGT